MDTRTGKFAALAAQSEEIVATELQASKTIRKVPSRPNITWNAVCIEATMWTLTQPQISLPTCINNIPYSNRRYNVTHHSGDHCWLLYFLSSSRVVNMLLLFIFCHHDFLHKIRSEYASCEMIRSKVTHFFSNIYLI